MVANTIRADANDTTESYRAGVAQSRRSSRPAQWLGRVEGGPSPSPCPRSLTRRFRTVPASPAERQVRTALRWRAIGEKNVYRVQDRTADSHQFRTGFPPSPASASSAPASRGVADKGAGACLDDRIDFIRHTDLFARRLLTYWPRPHEHWKVTTLVAGLRTSGITAPCVFDGAINGERFRAYVEQMLAPSLRPDDIVLLDNLSSHKTAGIAEAITAQGAQLIYLPPYSPDLNPIEQAFAKFKAALRQAAERTREGLWQAIGRTLDRYQPQECRNFFKNAGYAI